MSWLLYARQSQKTVRIFLGKIRDPRLKAQVHRYVQEAIPYLILNMNKNQISFV